MLKILRVRNSAWDFLGVNFWSREFFGFCWKPEGSFGVLIFAPIRSSPSLEIPSTPPPPWGLSYLWANVISHPPRRNVSQQIVPANACQYSVLRVYPNYYYSLTITARFGDILLKFLNVMSVISCPFGAKDRQHEPTARATRDSRVGLRGLAFSVRSLCGTKILAKWMTR